VQKWFKDVQKHAADHCITEFLMLDRLEGHTDTLGDRSARENDIEATKAEDPWHTMESLTWTDPEDTDALTGMVALHQMKVNQYESMRKKAIALKQVMLTPLPPVYLEDTDTCESPAEIYFAVHHRMLLQQEVVAATLDQEYAKLRNPVFSQIIPRQTYPLIQIHSSVCSRSTDPLAIHGKSVLKPPVCLEAALQQPSTEIDRRQVHCD
jgi:hypothetical protein